MGNPVEGGHVNTNIVGTSLLGLYHRVFGGKRPAAAREPEDVLRVAVPLPTVGDSEREHTSGEQVSLPKFSADGAASRSDDDGSRPKNNPNPLDTSTALQENIMSILGVIDAAEADAVNYFHEAAAYVTKAKAIWATFASTQNRAIALKLFADVIKAVNDTTAAAEAEATNITLDAAVVADVKTIIAEFKAGDSVIAADFKLLGISIK